MKAFARRSFRATALVIPSALLVLGCFGTRESSPARETLRAESGGTPGPPEGKAPPHSSAGADSDAGEERPSEEPSLARIEALRELQEKQRQLIDYQAELAAREAALAQERRRLQQISQSAPPARPAAVAAQPAPESAEPTVAAPVDEPRTASETVQIASETKNETADPGRGPVADSDHEEWDEQAWRRGSREAEPNDRTTSSERAPSTVEPHSARLEAGTVLNVDVESALSSSTSRVGEEFETRVAEDVRDETGLVVVPAGSVLLGFVTEARPLRRVGGRAALGLEFDRLVLPSGETIEVRASLMQQGKNKKRDKFKIAGATIAGAILGQILGGDSEATATGAAVGAAASTAAVLRVKGRDIDIPAGSRLEIELVEVVTWSARYPGVVG